MSSSAVHTRGDGRPRSGIVGRSRVRAIVRLRCRGPERSNRVDRLGMSKSAPLGASRPVFGARRRPAAGSGGRIPAGRPIRATSRRRSEITGRWCERPGAAEPRGHRSIGPNRTGTLPAPARPRRSRCRVRRSGRAGRSVGIDDGGIAPRTVGIGRSVPAPAGILRRRHRAHTRRVGGPLPSQVRPAGSPVRVAGTPPAGPQSPPQSAARPPAPGFQRRAHASD